MSELDRLLNSTQNDGDDAGGAIAAGGNAQRPGSASLTVTERLVVLTDNERTAPEILPYPGELIDQVQAELVFRRDEIEKMRAASLTANQQQAEDAEAAALFGIQPERAKNNGGAAGAGGAALNKFIRGSGANGNGNGNKGAAVSSTLPFRVEDLLNLELVRVKYAVADLIRVRLQKLQFFRASIVAEPTRYESLLSANEMLLVHSLHELFERAMLQGGIGQLPASLRSAPSTALPKPELATYVLATALDDCEIQLPGVDAPRLLTLGSSIICPYGAVRGPVMDGRMKLL